VINRQYADLERLSKVTGEDIVVCDRIDSFDANRRSYKDSLELAKGNNVIGVYLPVTVVAKDFDLQGKPGFPAKAVFNSMSIDERREIVKKTWEKYISPELIKVHEGCKSNIPFRFYDSGKGAHGETIPTNLVEKAEQHNVTPRRLAKAISTQKTKKVGLKDHDPCLLNRKQNSVIRACGGFNKNVNAYKTYITDLKTKNFCENQEDVKYPPKYETWQIPDEMIEDALKIIKNEDQHRAKHSDEEFNLYKEEATDLYCYNKLLKESIPETGKSTRNMLALPVVYNTVLKHGIDSPKVRTAALQYAENCRKLDNSFPDAGAVNWIDTIKNDGIENCGVSCGFIRHYEKILADQGTPIKLCDPINCPVQSILKTPKIDFDKLLEEANTVVSGEGMYEKVEDILEKASYLSSLKQDAIMNLLVAPTGFCQTKLKAQIRMFKTARNQAKPSKIGDALIKKHHFKTFEDTHEILVYNDGAYIPHGKELIHKAVVDAMGAGGKRTYTEETLHYVKGKTYVNRKDLEKTNINLVLLKNGVFNLKTKELQEHSHELFFLNKIPVAYDPEAECPKFKSFLESVLESECDILGIQELFGYSMRRNYDFRKGWIFYGDGWNGKSTLINILIDFLGKENVSNVDLHSLIYNQFAGSRLYGKLANTFADISSVKLTTADKFKALTGNDYVGVEKKGQDGFDILNYAKMIFSANKIPECDDSSDGFYDRFILIPFPFCFRDNDIPDLHKTMLDEMCGIFNWAIVGLDRLLKNGKFSNDIGKAETKSLWLSEASPLVDFVNQKCEVGTDNSIHKDVFYSAYCDYCRAVNTLPLEKSTVGKQLPRHFPIRPTRPIKGKKRSQHWAGVKLIDDAKNVQKKLNGVIM